MPSVGSAQESEHVDPVDELLEEVRNTPAFDSEALVRGLLLLGPRGCDELYRRIDDERSPGGSRLDASVKRLLNKARRGIPDYVGARVERGTIAGRRLEMEARLALRVLGDHGTASDLHAVIGFLDLESNGEPAPKSVTIAAKDALAQLLRRDGRSFDLLGARYDGASPLVQPAILQAVGSYACRDSLKFLAERLDGDSQHRLVVLAQLGRVAEVSGARPGTRALMQVSMQLNSADPAVRRESCLALGRLEEYEALGDLIELLADEEPGVRSAAHWALERISGTRMPPDLDRWGAWWERESSWWANEADALLENLHSENPGLVAASLRHFGTHRLFRNEIAQEVLTLFDHESEAIVAQACAALEVLRSRVAIEPLEQLLESGDARLIPHAERALRAIRN